ncbi:MAG TPA: T9SS type A sorting domain-containing protein [Parafilimonas sp.]|nr:T9SS type A sorting domain-containing protein [Parafilimonas sp.]
MKTLQLLKAICFLPVLIFIANKNYCQPGTLDLSFGIGGKVTTTFDSGCIASAASATQTDGKILLGGLEANKDKSDLRFALVRYLNNGNVDSSFGINGKATLDSLSYNAGFILLQPDGKILAAAPQEYFMYQGYYTSRFVIARFLSTGKFDSTFGLNGLVQTPFLGGDYAEGCCMALQPDGKILFTGNLNFESFYNFEVIRYNSNGTLDSSFGINGKVEPYESDLYGTPGIILLKNGKILISTNENGITFFKFNQDGTRDSTFGNYGIVKTHVNYYDSADNYAAPSASMILQKDKIIVAGDTTIAKKEKMMLARFKLNGQIDSSFGVNGRATASFDVYFFENVVALQSDGSIVAAGNSSNGDSVVFAMARFKKDGLIDKSFGINGKVTTTFGCANNYLRSIAIQQDDKIILSGLAYDTVTDNIALARYNNDVILPLSFLSFTATKQNLSVSLNWQTVNETNNNYFSVEKSSDGKIFNQISKVYSKDNSSKTQSYNATDVHPVQGWNYYRLKQVDKDGKFSYSSIASAFFDDNEMIIIHPNPANNFIYIDGLQENNSAGVFITDLNGKTLGSIKTNQSSNKINIQNLSAGIYYINIVQNGKSIKQKFVKE